MTAIIAHRGASRAQRENTLAAFRAARVFGADAVELDVRRTRDGVLVVHHDPYVVPVTAVIDQDVESLPAHIPRLDAALDACTGMWVNVEIKNDSGEPDFDPTESSAEQTMATFFSSYCVQSWVFTNSRKSFSRSIKP